MAPRPFHDMGGAGGCEGRRKRGVLSIKGESVVQRVGAAGFSDQNVISDTGEKIEPSVAKVN